MAVFTQAPPISYLPCKAPPIPSELVSEIDSPAPFAALGVLDGSS